MKATEFVKRFGWDGAISFTDWYGGNTAFKFLKVKEKTISVHSGDQPYDFHINDLKQLVESHELVKTWQPPEDYNDETRVDGARMYLEYHASYSTDVEKAKLDRLAQAIKDVESCQ